MFFTDELLMAKRGSLGIIWLVSTLGPRNKRVNRKALEKVEISRTCDLIASPPEPLALRLSGQLLVGVARVYSQNYEHFYSDVQTFDSALRRSIAFDFGPMGKLAGGTELDLPGGGRTRLELITFPDFEPGLEGYFGIDFEFANIDWLNPDLSNMSRDRRHTTPLDSLKTQSVRYEDYEGEEPRVKHLTPLHTTPNTTSDKVPTYKPFESQRKDVPDVFEPMDLDINLDPLPNDPSSDGMMPAPFNSDGLSDLPFDTGNFDLLPPDVGPADFILPDQLHSSPTRLKRKGSSSQEASDVESQLVPAPKPKKKKRVKRTEFDNDLELGLDLAGMGAAYVEAMAQKRKELNAKARKKEAAREAERLLLGDTWFKFLDPDMSSFINGSSSIGKFKWQLDVEGGGQGPRLETADPVGTVDPIHPHPGSDDPFIDPQPIVDYNMDYPEIPDIPEMDRDQHNFDLEAGRVASASDLPWMDHHSDFTDLPGPIDSGQTSPQVIKTPRVSDMSALELSIRKRQLNSSTARDYTNRSRSGSVISINNPGLENIQLVSDDDADQLPEDDLNTRFPQGHPFAPTMLATLEDQCRDFFSFVDKTMLKTGTDELELTDFAPRGQSKRVAATAFHNCLTLATKRLLNLSQDTAYGPITIRIPPA